MNRILKNVNVVLSKNTYPYPFQKYTKYQWYYSSGLKTLENKCLFDLPSRRFTTKDAGREVPPGTVENLEGEIEKDDIDLEPNGKSNFKDQHENEAEEEHQPYEGHSDDSTMVGIMEDEKLKDLAEKFVNDRDELELEQFYKKFSRKPNMTPFRAPLEVEPDDNESYDGDDPTLWFEQLQDQVFPDEEENVVFEKCPGKLQAKGTRPSRCKKIDLRELHPTNIPLLSKFLMSSGMIKGKKYTGLCAKCQRKVAKTIKFSRQLGLIPFVTDLEVIDTDPRAQTYKYRDTKITSKTI